MKSGILLSLVWALSMAGCECPSMVEHPGGAGAMDYGHGDGWRWGALPPARPAPATDSVTYLGVQTVQVGEPLRAQLSLPEGAGLLVAAVLPDSPAAAAKLARFDVLVRINRQYLINPEQLEVLVRDAKPGQDVRLTVIRQAKIGSVMVRLGSRKISEGPVGTPAHAMRGAPMGPGWGRGIDGRMGPGAWGRPMREDGEEPMPGMWGHGSRERRDGPAERPGPAARDGREGFKGEMVFEAHEGDAVIQAFRDGEYALRLVTDAKGGKTLTARSVKDPKAVFEGPVNTPAERAKLPPPVQRRLEQIEKAPKVAPPDKPAK
jgi:hypothetical protein